MHEWYFKNDTLARFICTKMCKLLTELNGLRFFLRNNTFGLKITAWSIFNSLIYNSVSGVKI